MKSTNELLEVLGIKEEEVKDLEAFSEKLWENGVLNSQEKQNLEDWATNLLVPDQKSHFGDDEGSGQHVTH